MLEPSLLLGNQVLADNIASSPAHGLQQLSGPILAAHIADYLLDFFLKSVAVKLYTRLPFAGVPVNVVWKYLLTGMVALVENKTGHCHPSSVVFIGELLPSATSFEICWNQNETRACYLLNSCIIYFSVFGSNFKLVTVQSFYCLLCPAW